MSGRGRWGVALLVGAVLTGAYGAAPGQGGQRHEPPHSARRSPAIGKVAAALGAVYLVSSLVAGGLPVLVVEHDGVSPQPSVASAIGIREETPNQRTAAARGPANLGTQHRDLPSRDWSVRARVITFERMTSPFTEAARGWIRVQQAERWIPPGAAPSPLAHR